MFASWADGEGAFRAARRAVANFDLFTQAIRRVYDFFLALVKLSN
jgi:hypothetical protein